MAFGVDRKNATYTPGAGVTRPKPAPAAKPRVVNPGGSPQPKGKLKGNRVKPALAQQVASSMAARDQALADNIGDVTQPLTGDTLVKSAQTLVDKEYAPQFADLDQQGTRIGAQRDAQQAWSQNYYNNLSGVFGSTLGAQQQANSAATEAARQRAAEQMAGIQTTQNDATMRAAQDAQVRGAGLDGGAAATLSNQTAQAQQGALAQGATDQAATANYGAVQEALLRGIGSATAQAGGEAQADIGAAATTRLGELDAQRKTLNNGRMGQLTDTLLKMRQNEGDRYLTQQSLATDAEKAKLQAAVDIQQSKDQKSTEAAKLRYQAALTRAGWAHDDAKAEADREFRAEQGQLDRSSREGIAATRATTTAAAKAKSPWASGKDQGKASDTIQKAISVAKGLSKSMTRQQAGQYLLNGVKGQPQFREEKTANGGTKQVRVLNETGQPVVGRSIEAVDQAYAQAALDIAYNGKLSRATVKKLHDRGITIDALGLPTNHDPRPSNKPMEVMGRVLGR